VKRLALVGLLSALVLMACTSQQEINVSANRQATITQAGDGKVSLRLSGYLWCNRPVAVDFFVRVRQDNVETSAGDETIYCDSEDPAPWSQIFEFTYQGAQVPHVGTREVLTLQASTNESGRENNDFVELERFIDIS
jgi:hypothetical protein